MINRTLVRAKVIQTLYAYYQDGEKTTLSAQKDLIHSFEDTYDLYALLLDLMNELTTYAQMQIEQQQEKAKVTHKTFIPNYKFVRNQLAQQIFHHSKLRNYLTNAKLAWDAGHTAIAALYKELVEQPYYQEYLANPETSYDEDKMIWKKIFSHLLPNNPQLESALEELELALDHANWTTDMEFVLSFVVKTIRRFQEGDASLQELMPMFSSEEELEFAKKLLQTSLDNEDTYVGLINSHLKNWEATRIALMDRIILQVALAEIISFPDIALQVSMNEYIELSKEYSSDKSYTFVNGVLNEILQEMKADNTLFKAMTIR